MSADIVKCASSSAAHCWKLLRSDLSSRAKYYRRCARREAADDARKRAGESQSIEPFDHVYCFVRMRGDIAAQSIMQLVVARCLLAEGHSSFALLVSPVIHAPLGDDSPQRLFSILTENMRFGVGAQLASADFSGEMAAFK